MTNDQAIQLLHRLQDEQFDGEHGDERREALEMAVRALEGDGDTISRQQAIEAFDNGAELIKRALDEINIVGNEREKFTWGLGLLESCIDDLKELPSAQPQRKKGKWIVLDFTQAWNYKCDQCGRLSDFKDNFCPNCGAKMEVEHE